METDLAESAPSLSDVPVDVLIAKYLQVAAYVSVQFALGWCVMAHTPRYQNKEVMLGGVIDVLQGQRPEPHGDGGHRDNRGGAKVELMMLC